MDSAAGVTMVAAALAPLSLAVVGQTAFMIATYASYARKDTRSPLRSMMLEVVLCLGVASFSLLVHGPTVLVVLGLAMSVSVVVAACHLMIRMLADPRPPGTQRLTPSLARFVAGAAIMAGPAWLTATAVPRPARAAARPEGRDSRGRPGRGGGVRGRPGSVADPRGELARRRPEPDARQGRPGRGRESSQWLAGSVPVPLGRTRWRPAGARRDR